MSTLVIREWQPERGWASPSSWPLSAFCQRIQMCTRLRGTELKRVARAVMKKELLVLESVDDDKASPLLHTLESLGAQAHLRSDTPPA